MTPEAGGRADEAMQLLARANECLARHRYTDAELPARRCWALCSVGEELSETEKAAAAHNLAVVCEARGALGEAEELHRRSIALAERPMVQDAPRPMVIALRGLATNLRIRIRVEEADGLFVRALALAELSFGAEDSEVATLLRELGTLHREAGRMAESEAALRRGLAALGRGAGLAHVEAANLYRELAALEHSRGRNDAATGYIEEARTIRATQPVAIPWEQARDDLVFASLLVSQSRHDEAEPLLRSAIAIFTESAGGRSPWVAATACQLAGLLAGAGRPDEARRLYEQALDVLEHAFGPDHPVLAPALHDLALLCQQLGDEDTASALWDRAHSALLEPTTDEQAATPPSFVPSGKSN